MNRQSGQRRLILARHGESESNAANIFTGWFDARLTSKGEKEAGTIACLLAQHAINPAVIFTSALQRAIVSAEIVRSALQRAAIELVSTSTLNERDYGRLTGLNKTEAAARFGGEQVQRWRRSWAEAPPGGESLRDTAARVLPYYIHDVQPRTVRGEDVLVIAHGNSLRALSMALEGLSPEQIETLEFPTGGCRLYELASDTSIERVQLLTREQPSPTTIVEESAA